MSPWAAVLNTNPAAWYDARDLATTSQQTLRNRVNTGATAAQLGSTSGSDTNDPLVGLHTGINYLWSPVDGVTSYGNQFRATYAAAFDITGDIELIARVSSPDWAMGGGSDIIAKGTGDYKLQVAGAFRFVGAGTNGVSTVNANTVLNANTIYWIKCDRRQSDGRTRFWYAADQASEPASWTQIGANVTIASGTALTTGANAISSGSGAKLSIYRLIVRSGMDGVGSIVFETNPTTETLGQTTWTSTSGHTMTVVRATNAPAAAVVTRPLLNADGVDDFLQLPAGDTPTFTNNTGAMTVAAVLRCNPNTVEETIYSSGSNTSEAARLFITAAGVVTARVGDSTPTNVDSTVGTGLDNSALRMVAGIWNAGTVTAWDSVTGAGTGQSYAALGTITHQQPRMLARAAGTAAASRHELMAVLKWDRALNTTELGTVATFLTGVYT